MENSENPFKMTQEFHRVFGGPRTDYPRPFSLDEAVYRAGFKAEELVEFLYGAAENNQPAFHKAVQELKAAIDTAEAKMMDKDKRIEDNLVDQTDALIDLLYFTYGSFSLMGVEPENLFKIVHEANMGKLYPDGQPRYHEVTHKVLKPDNWEKDFAPEPKIKAELQRQLNIKKQEKTNGA